MTALRIGLLGPPRIEVDGAPLDVDTRKAVALLARLVLNGSEGREAFTALLWPDSDGERARASLRRTLSALNKGLGRRWIVADRERIALETDDGVWSDVAAFAELRRDVDTHEHDPTTACAACVEALERAVELHRGRFLAGFSLRDTAPFDTWCATVGERLERELGEALDLLVSIHTRRDDLDAAIRHARRRLELDPLREATHRRLMLLHAWSGQRGDAMRQFRECVAVLDRELGVPPLEQTTELNGAIVAGRLPDRPSPAPIHRSSAPPRPRLPTAPLVAREGELERLRAAHAAAESAGHVVVVEGEAGIGKTRLVDEFVRGVRDRGVRTVTVRCYEEERNIAYGTVAEVVRAAAGADPERLTSIPDSWLREVGRLAPELLANRPELEPSGTLETGEARRRFHEGFRQVLAAGLSGPMPSGPRPGVIVIDDVHWADDPSQGALAYLVRRLRDLPICLVLIWRGELLPVDDTLERLTGELVERGRATRIALPHLTDGELAELVRTAGAVLDEPVEARLIRESEGLPLFAVEYLRAIVEAPDADPWSTPAGIQELIEDRLADVSDAARQTLSAAATIGRSFGFETLLRASGRDPEEVVSSLEELSDAAIISEIRGGADPRYDFAHDKLRTVVYDRTSSARRRLLHGRVADALRDGRGGTDAGAPPAGLLAHHLRRAGRRAEAAAAHADAAEEATRLSAHDEAIGHLRDALELDHPAVCRLNRSLGDLLTLQGDYPGALHAYAAAAAHAEGGDEVARIEHRIAAVHERRGDWPAAEAHIEAGLAAASDGASALHAKLHADLALVAYRRDEGRRAATEARQAIELAASAGDDVVQAQALNLLGMLTRYRGDTETAVDHLEESLALAVGMDDLAPQVAALNNLALVRGERGDDGEALELAKAALGLCRRLGDRHREAALLNNLGDLLHRAGQRDEALDYIKRAVRVFSEVGEPERHEPEIWKLVEW